MVTMLYRWNMPRELHAAFQADWQELSTQVQREYGMYSATLYVDDTIFLSVSHWPDQQSWQRWVSELRNHPYRVRWREYGMRESQRYERVAHIEP